ncbi:Down syndrome critical region protein 3 homolog isoform X2 [Amborella trichopoda]|uniref:Vacuolar protein sorting-associated protein 26C n=1 Tax=Amborella trichopoda TaxID=13333 RepID=W1NU69_AMBTC|nr:Down syndrome critical region protein 3 homolog isoform X2 [Amborella trichopoda]ERM98810.1 hypothetical protein AMTR_s00093p00102680 [Amborella trichopoda]|eukprot:XP_006833532.1 Down syndrome critical region protein 3 homolog isoform X2 [Amborella trichopoda]
MSVELKLSRPNRVYRPSEPVQGKILVTSPSPIAHQGIRVSVTGNVNLQVRGGSVGVIESLYSMVKPICIMTKTTEVTTSGKLTSGRTEIPFSISLTSSGQDESEGFFETFHGANITIQYLLIADISRGYLHKSLCATMEFIIESEKAKLLDVPVSSEMIIFYITQDTQRHHLLPELLSGGFRVTGKISSQCSLLDPISGDLTVEVSPVPIHSLDIQLLRVESILVGEKFVTDTSVIQTTQIADGDIDRCMTLPIYIIIPRLLACPTVLAGPFSVEFQVSIVISFQSELAKQHPRADLRAPKPWLASETIPLKLIRTKRGELCS